MTISHHDHKSLLAVSGRSNMGQGIMGDATRIMQTGRRVRICGNQRTRLVAISVPTRWLCGRCRRRNLRVLCLWRPKTPQHQRNRRSQRNRRHPQCARRRRREANATPAAGRGADVDLRQKANLAQNVTNAAPEAIRCRTFAARTQASKCSSAVICSGAGCASARTTGAIRDTRMWCYPSGARSCSSTVASGMLTPIAKPFPVPNPMSNSGR